MFKKDFSYLKNTVVSKTGQLRKEYRSYESEILVILDEKQLTSFKVMTRLLFEVLPDNSLVSLRKKIKQKKNRPSEIEDLLISYFDKYKIEVPIKKKYKRKKENSIAIKLRVSKYRASTKKVSLQLNCHAKIKKEFDKLKKERSQTSEELLNSLLGYPISF